MNKKDLKALEAFACEYKRIEEQDFASTFSGNPDVNLYFLLENKCYTDGKNIVLDPHILELFCDEAAWIKTIKMLQPIGFSLDFTNRYLTLEWITKSVNIHESSHVLYTNFPSIASRVNKNKLYTMILASVSNIIEDAFIDRKAIESYSNAYAYIYLFRILQSFRTKYHHSSTVTENLANTSIDDETKNKIEDILDYFTVLHVYPMFEVIKEEYIFEEIRYLEPLFEEAAKCGNPNRRDELSVCITDYLYDEVLDEEAKKDADKQDKKMKNLEEKLKELLFDFEVGNGSYNYSNYTHNGLNTSDAPDSKLITISDLAKMLNETADDVENALSLLMQELEENQKTKNGSITVFEPNEITKDKIHRGVRLEEILPPVDNKLKAAYDSIKDKYKININSFNRQFTKLLKGKCEIYGDKKIVGAVLSSKNFADPKERFWKQKEEETQIPDLGIIFMLDGSGSMADIIDDAKESLIIVHETLKKFGIKHSVILHQAIGDMLLVKHHVLLPFNPKRGQEYSILKPLELEYTREGISLMWSIKYFERIICERKIVVMISDGMPYHAGEDFEYGPPQSIVDARNARIKLEALGYTVIGIALHGCYDYLIQIYDKVIECNDIIKLTGKLLQLISAEIDKY